MMTRRVNGWIRRWCRLLICFAMATWLGHAAMVRDAFRTRLARGPWSGAITATSAEVRAKVDISRRPVRLWVSRNPGLIPANIFGPVFSDTNQAANVVGFTVPGLIPNTTYYYAFEVAGELERAKAGRFHTFPQVPSSFEFAFASCGRTGSINASYDCIRRHNPLFFLCPGDFHYEDVNSVEVGKFHRAYDRVFASPVQARLYREIPLVYMWDDHDFCGNNSDDLAIGRVAVRRAYQDYFPHYPFW